MEGASLKGMKVATTPMFSSTFRLQKLTISQKLCPCNRQTVLVLSSATSRILNGCSTALIISCYDGASKHGLDEHSALTLVLSGQLMEQLQATVQALGLLV